ncbi:MAG: glycosyltransferase, partial [Candidatus Accumulibacter sp.]|nr:glycosyltransferase [Accumulibacter sp.]
MEESSRFIRLNLGCGDRILPGFINIDTLPGVDMQLDVRQGLPFPDASCDTVFSEHFIEHLDRREGLRLLREIRRVLKTGGILRIATPDLEQAVDDYQRNFTHEDFARFGISWARTRCEKLNIGMREWGHKWIYDQEELQRVAEIAGLKFAERCRIGESRHERLQQLEHRAGSRLILEFSKPDRRLAADAAPLVSILILSYKPRYFEKALKSALDQTWKNIEIIVSDDCPDDGIEKIVKKFSSDPRIRYLRNPLPSGGYDNGIHCFEISSGEFIKFLNDDDILMPDCVERLLDGFRKYPDITLAFSKRTLIDANDRILPDQAYTAPLSHEDCVLNGLGLSAGLSVTASNFIGEPSTVLFRKSGLASNKPDFMSLAGHDRIYVLNDHAMWHTLLSAGNAAYVAAPLSCFRIHAEQRQKDAEVPELARASWVKLQEGLYRLGLIGPEPEIVASRILPLGNHPFFMKAEIEKLTALVKCKDCDWPVYDRLGDCAKKMGDVTLAISWYRRAMEKAPAPLRENLKLVKLLMESDCFAEAVEILERYLDRFPDDKKAREWFLTACEARATLQNHERTCPAASLLEYSSWLERRSEGSLLETLHLERIERLWKTRPLFEIALILKPGQEALLADTIDSLAGQGYDGWRLAIFAQSASPEPEFTADSEPVRWIVCSSEDVVDDINACLAASSAHWFGFFDCGTRFSEDAFLMLGDYIAICPQWRVIYTDDDFVAPNGGLHSPRFKPDLNLEFLRSTDYVGGFFIEKQALIEAGGFSMAAGAERYDLLLRAIDALGETSVGHIPEIPVHLPDRLPPCAENEGATSALRRHFDRRKTPVSLLPGLLAGETRRVVYLHEEKPKVSIIVPTRNRLDLLGPCVESLVK